MLTRRHTSDLAVMSDLRAERRRDIEARLRPRRTLVFAILIAALVVCAPWLGWVWVAPLCGAIVLPRVCLEAALRHGRPELWEPAAWGAGPAMIAVIVATTGGPTSAAIPLFIIPAVTLAARFDGRGLTGGTAFLGVLMLAATAAVHPTAFAADPTRVVLAMAMTAAVLQLTAAVVDSERDHRLDAVVDPLTGLLNRAALVSRVPQLDRALLASVAPQLAVIVADIDDFKTINDEYGHTEGDGALRAVGSIMHGHLRPQDLLYRPGGDEFVAIVPGASAPDAHRVAERLRAAVAGGGVLGTGVTVSLGVATAPADGTSIGELYRAADEALYQAKRDGRNRVHSRLAADRSTEAAQAAIAPLV